MAGIYVHVPFCKTRCIYCDFFTGTDTREKNSYVSAVCQEIELRSDYLGDESVGTIYFGGGTPSQLSIEDIRGILDSIRNTFKVEEDAEITLEANPDDLNSAFLTSLLELGANRLSLGVQSFDDEMLVFLKRRHSGRKAMDIVSLSKDIGFSNISIDLMYGLPRMTMPLWEATLNKAIELDIQHISSYHLIYEEGTPLSRMLEKGQVNAVEENKSLDMFSLMIEKLTAAGFIHYEISNFGKKNYLSRHNTSYWQDIKYLGLGPAAHSFDKKSRSWNVASISGYIKGIRSGFPSLETEILDAKTSYNDFVLTGLRTMWGIDSIELEKRFGRELFLYFKKNVNKHILTGNVICENNLYKFSRQGIFISDSIMSDLMFVC